MESNTSGLEELRKWIGTIAIPLAIAYWGYQQHQSTILTSKKSQEKEVLLKFMELSWSSIESQDTNRIKNAINLLSTIDDEVAIKLANVIIADTSKNKSIRVQAQNVITEISNRKLDNLEVRITYIWGNPNAVAIAQRIQDSIKVIAPNSNFDISGLRVREEGTAPNTIYYNPKNKIAAELIRIQIEKGFPFLFFQFQEVKDFKENEVAVRFGI